MRYYLSIFCLIILSSSLMATQLQIVGEILTTPGCGPCLPARSALHQMYEDKENFGDLIPLIWLGAGRYASPGYIERSVLYLRRFVPYARWGGLLDYSGARGDVYDQYVLRYRQISQIAGRLELDLDYELLADYRLQIFAEAETLEGLEGRDERIIYIITYNLEDEMPGEMYFANVMRYADEEFLLKDTGERGVYTHTFDLDPSWDRAKLKIVVLIQSFYGDRAIHQAAAIKLEE